MELWHGDSENILTEEGKVENRIKQEKRTYSVCRENSSGVNQLVVWKEKMKIGLTKGKYENRMPPTNISMWILSRQ